MGKNEKNPPGKSWGIRAFGSQRAQCLEPWEGECCWWRPPPHVPELAQTLLFAQPSPGQSSLVAGWQLLSRPQPQAAKVGSLTATPHNSTPLLLSLFLPDTHSLLFIWITFLCYAISVVFPIPPSTPLPFPLAGFLRRQVFEESCKHICSLAAAFQEGPVRGSGPREPGHAGWGRLAGREQGPRQLRPIVGTLTAACRAEPQGSWVLPKSWSRSSPTPWSCWLWLLALSAQVRVCQAWGEKNKEPSKIRGPSISSSVSGS